MWRLNSGQRLDCRGWGEEFVVYNDLSGDTHLIDGLAMHLLTVLRDSGPTDQRGLLDACEGAISADGAASAADELANVMGALHALALVERL